MQGSGFTLASPSPPKRQREEGASSVGERETKRVRSEEALPEVGPALPTSGVPVVAAEQHVSVQPDMPILSGGVMGASVLVSSGGEEEGASGYEAVLSPRGEDVEGEALAHTEVPPTEEEALAQARTPMREEASTSVEERSTQVEVLPSEGEAPVLEEVPAQGEEVLGREEASTPMVAASSAAVQAPSAEETLLSPPARIKKKLVETAIQSFETLLSESVQMVLDESGSFGELMPMLQMYVDNLTTLMGQNAASAYQRRLASAEKGIRELLSLRSEKLVEMASAREQSVREQRQRSVDDLKAKEAELVKAVEQIVAEGKEVDEERQKAKSSLAETDEAISTARRTIEELQAVLVNKALAREQALKRLEELEGRQQLTIADFEEKSKALEETRSKLQSTASLNEEGLRRQIMADLERDHRKKLQEAESRLRGF